MKALTCEMCGSTDLIKEGGVFVCQSCGTKYSVEEAKKMMVEGTVDVKGTVKIDTSSELQNLYEIARRAKDSGNNEQAEKYYDQILVKDPSSWEANYYAVYFKAMSCKIAEIWSAGHSMSNCLEPVLTLVKNNVIDEEEQKKVLSEIYARTSSISDLLSSAARNHYEGIDIQIQADYVQEYVDNASESATTMYLLGDLVDTLFEGKYNTISANAWDDGINIHNQYLKYLVQKQGNIEMMQGYIEKIKKYNPDYKAPEFDQSSGGCYVATAVYGSYDCPEVWTLRRFRDNTLDSTWYGRLFIKTYYAISPTLVKWFGNTTWFKNFWRGKLDKMVSELRERGVESTPYKDKY